MSDFALIVVLIVSGLLFQALLLFVVVKAAVTRGCGDFLARLAGQGTDKRAVDATQDDFRSVVRWVQTISPEDENLSTR